MGGLIPLLIGGFLKDQVCIGAGLGFGLHAGIELSNLR